MCGIAGIVGEKRLGQEELKALALRMADRLTHRGPDDSGVYVDSEAALSHRRLSIIDLSPLGKQPMRSACGRYVVAYNGELYNFPSLRDEMEKDHQRQFRSRSDTEVLLEALSVWGTEALNRFNGMFAFALWDRDERSLLLARDPMGIKPLYYCVEGGTLRFASEIKALFADPDFNPRINLKGLANYFAYRHAVAPDTLLAGVHKLEPGQWLKWKDGKIAFGEHGSSNIIPDAVDQHFKTESEACEALREVIGDAVSRQLVSDVPVGIFLSGGIDSSVLSLLASQKLGAGNTRTFCLGFKGMGHEFDETKDAGDVARFLGTEHKTLVADVDDMLDALETMVGHYDEPFGDPAALPTMLLSRLTRQHVTVCLSGEGGDELFGGYFRYLTEKTLAGYPRLTAIARYLGPLGIFNAISRRYKSVGGALAYEDFAGRTAYSLTIFGDEERKKLLKPEWVNSGYSTVDVIKRLDPDPSAGALSRISMLDRAFWLPGLYLEKADKASMAVSLEVRVPFLDNKVVEFANAMPDRYRIKGFAKKYLLRKAFRGLLPDSTLDKKKHGFSVPLSAWFRGKLGETFETKVLGPDARSAEIFERDYVSGLLERHRSGAADTSVNLWLVLLLEMWLRKFNISTSGPGHE